MHNMISVVFFYCEMSYILFIVLFLMLIILISFIYTLSCYDCIHTDYMHEHLPLFYALIGSLTDKPRFSHPHCMFYFIVQVLDETIHVARSWSLSLLDYWSSYSLLFILFLHSLYITCSCQFFLMDTYMCYCSDHDLLYFKFIACSSYLKLSAYTWGIFLTRRVSAPAYFGKRGVT